MPKLPTPRPEADLDKPVVITARVSGRLYNALIAESRKRDRSTVAGELERLIRRCVDLESIFGREEIGETQLIARNTAAALKLANDTGDDAPLRSAMIYVAGRLWRQHKVRTHEVGAALKERFSDVIEQQLADDQVKAEGGRP